MNGKHKKRAIVFEFKNIDRFLCPISRFKVETIGVSK